MEYLNCNRIIKRKPCLPLLHLPTSCNQSASSSGIIFESRGNLLFRLVIPCQTMDSGLDEDQAELGVLVLSICFKMFADGDRLFDEVPKVLWDGRCQSYPQTKGV
jgi:hypothetical protein